RGVVQSVQVGNEDFRVGVKGRVNRVPAVERVLEGSSRPSITVIWHDICSLSLEVFLTTQGGPTVPPDYGPPSVGGLSLQGANDESSGTNPDRGSAFRPPGRRLRLPQRQQRPRRRRRSPRVNPGYYSDSGLDGTDTNLIEALS